MRKDQPKLMKELKNFRTAVKCLQKIVSHRDSIIDDLYTQLTNKDEEILIARIEYDRLFRSIPPLTKAYTYQTFIAR